ncbi:MAG: HD domain-containing protein [Myxococcales bacterium]|nr:HD domain-containing protein [Myxococcales bacterium]
MADGGTLRIRDAVHGDLVFEDDLGALVRDLIDTPVFQRLRHIKQNGVTNLVFPGAEHTRFAHSLGVAGMAQRMLDAIEKNSPHTKNEIQERRPQIVVAALLHDVGHGPFSHTFEETVGAKFVHDKMSAKIIKSADGDGLGHIIDKHLRPGSTSEIADYVAGTGDSPHWGAHVVSSQLDADRLDYVRRDAKLAGISNTSPDTDRLVGALHIVDNHIVVAHRAYDVIETLLLALDHLYDRIYFHKAVRAATLLLKSAIARAAEQPHAIGNDALADMLTVGDDVDIGKFVTVTEVSVWECVSSWQDSRDPVLRKLAKMLTRRSLMKSVDLNESGFAQADILASKARELTAAEFDGDLARHLVHIDDADRLNYKRYSADSKKPPIYTWSPGDKKPVRIEDAPRSIVRSVVQPISRGRLYFPAPIYRDLMKFGEERRILTDAQLAKFRDRSRV